MSNTIIKKKKEHKFSLTLFSWWRRVTLPATSYYNIFMHVSTINTMANVQYNNNNKNQLSQKHDVRHHEQSTPLQSAITCIHQLHLQIDHIHFFSPVQESEGSTTNGCHGNLSSHLLKSLANDTDFTHLRVSHKMTLMFETLKAMIAWKLWLFATLKFNMSQQCVLCGILLKAIRTPETWWQVSASLFRSYSGITTRLVIITITVILWISKRIFN